MSHDNGHGTQEEWNGLFDRKMKRMLQTVLLYDERFAKKMFSHLQRLNARNVLPHRDNEKGSHNTKQMIEIPIDKTLVNLIKITADHDREIADISAVTLQLLEVITLNQIRLQGNIEELLKSLAGSRKSQKTKMTKLSQRFKSENKDFQNAAKKIKEMNRYHVWIKRRFEELKKGEPI